MSSAPVESSVFTYGTLMVPAVMEAVTGRTFSLAKAALPGFERYAVRDAVYPGLMEAKGGRTTGVVYSGVSERDLAVLDRFEDWLYERRLVSIELEGQGPCGAWAWIVPDRHAHALEDRPWDLAAFERSHLQDYLESCRSFRRSDRLEHRPNPQKE